MKKLCSIALLSISWVFVLFLFLSSISAHADEWYTVDKDQNVIVVTELRCPNKSYLNYAYKRTSNGNRVDGCWAIVDQLAHVVFYGKPEATFQLNTFKKIKS